MNERDPRAFILLTVGKWNLRKRHISKHKIFSVGVPDFNPYKVNSIHLLLLKMYV